MAKRAMDLLIAGLAAIVLSPLFLAAAVAVKLDSPGPVFFRQRRIGRNFKPFYVLKFRTMVAGAEGTGPAVTAAGDPRVTRVGRILRATKFDELPQLFNVLKGDMSLVGPRPEVERYVEMYRDQYALVLTVRPGITDPASIRFRDEEQLLARAADREREYVERLLPEKLELARAYVRNPSVARDLGLLAQTLAALLRRGKPASGKDV